MEQVFSLYNMLAGKVREEIPDLNLVALLFDTPSWHRCRFQATNYLTAQFGEQAGELCEMMNSGERFENSLSLKYPRPIFTDNRETRTSVFQVNLDQAAWHQGEPLTAAQGILAHEAAHAISGHKRSGHDYWQLYEEEALADIFSCAVMANQRKPEYMQRALEYRFCAPHRPGQLGITSTEHSFPAVVDQAAGLIAEYGRRPVGDFSVTRLKQEAQGIVRRNSKLVREWCCFASVAMDLADAGYGAGDVLALARSAGSPFVKTIEALTDFRAAASAPALADNPFVYPEEFFPRKRVERGAAPEKVKELTHGKRWFGYTVMHNERAVAAERPSA